MSGLGDAHTPGFVQRIQLRHQAGTFYGDDKVNTNITATGTMSTCVLRPLNQYGICADCSVASSRSLSLTRRVRIKSMDIEE